ncbi:hypothetical protein [Dethiosulfatibacter aminovorans]|nr:hypothetical protein [Dethiosulfatibacter aminovorans]
MNRIFDYASIEQSSKVLDVGTASKLTEKMSCNGKLLIAHSMGRDQLNNIHTRKGRAVSRDMLEAVGYYKDFETFIEEEVKQQVKCGQSEDFKEGVTAFIEKRKDIAFEKKRFCVFAKEYRIE